MKHKPRTDQSDFSWKFVFWYTFTNLYMYRKRNWTNEFWQPLCGEWMGDVLRTENLPQHISRSLLRSTQQSCTWKPDRTGLIFVITYQVPSLSETEHKMHINSNNTHTHTSLYLFLSCSALCLCNAIGSCVQNSTYLYYLLFFVLFCSPSLARSLGVWCFFIWLAWCLLCCLYWMFCAAYMYIYAHTHASLCFGHTHIIHYYYYIIIIAILSVSAARNSLFCMHISKEISV